MTEGERSLASQTRSPTTQVRQGITLGVMRWVLLVSLVAVVAGLVIVFAVMPSS